MYYGKTSDPFYRSPAWRRLRAVALERDPHICQDCLQQKRMGARIRARRAVVVHHILPRETHPELALELTNLVSLCDACHNKRHPEKGGRSAAGGQPGQGPKPAPRGVRIIKV